VVIHIQDQVLAHDCQTDQRDVCRLFHDLVLSIPDDNLTYNMRRARSNRAAAVRRCKETIWAADERG
jgi:hypothetical protein